MVATMANHMDLSLLLLFGLMVNFSAPYCCAFTNELDVFAINSFYAALGSPPLPGWTPNGGDPCAEGWQGVQCIESNITGIVINGANLGGQLGDGLGNFSSITTIDLSNNNIGGSIPENLPLTLQRFFLSANQFTGSIPSSLSTLKLLTDMSVNNNYLTGDLPDAFSSLTGLINFDLSFNNLSGELPSSMASLSSLTTLHVQNNQLYGMLNVLVDLPLKDLIYETKVPWNSSNINSNALNIENNLFSGPVPEKLLTIPNFKKDGNPFNTSIAPSMAPPESTPASSASSPSGVPTPDAKHSNSTNGSSSPGNSQPADQGNSQETRKGSMSTMKVIGYVIASVFLVIIIVLATMFCLSKYRERKSKKDELLKSQVDRPGRGGFKEPKSGENFGENFAETDKKFTEVVKEDQRERKKEYGPDMPVADTFRSYSPVVVPKSPEKEEEHIIDLSGTNVIVLPPPPPPPLEKIIVNPIAPSKNIVRPSPEIVNIPPTSATSFSVADLQQYTNSFSEENLTRDGRLGKVYLAEFPDGKLLEVMKLDNVNSRIPVVDFLDLVVTISELRHANTLELVGYCAEFDQRLLVYKYVSKKTLQDILHVEDDLKNKLSWSARLEIALGAAKALEYLHESCQPPLVHQNFGSANLLLDEKLIVCVTECGLSSLRLSNSVTQLSGRLSAMYSYEAPEINESGQYTDKSDVYSFGVVMLELLTGRKPYDSARPRSEQHLVRWASSQLYDINALSKMVDPSLGGRYHEKSLSCFADTISRCIQLEPEFRPAMSEVVQDLMRMVKDAK